MAVSRYCNRHVVLLIYPLYLSFFFLLQDYFIPAVFHLHTLSQNKEEEEEERGVGGKACVINPQSALSTSKKPSLLLPLSLYFLPSLHPRFYLSISLLSLSL